MTPKPIDAWKFWQKSREALDELQEVMEVCARYVSEAGTLKLPPHPVKRAKRALARFEENFTLIVREQKRKAEKR